MNTHQYQIGVHTLEFYQDVDDPKFRFRIVGNDELTQEILSRVKTKRVKEKNIRYAVKGLRELIDKIERGEPRAATPPPTAPASAPPKKPKKMPYTERLNKKCYMIWGELPRYRVHSAIEDEEYFTSYTMLLTLPDGADTIGRGETKELAREEAAKKIIDYYGW